MPYTKKNIDEALEKLGVKSGEILFIHSNIGFFGKLEEAKDASSLCSIFYDRIFKRIGPGGTIVVPAFTYSFPRQEVYHSDIQVSEMGIFSEWVRTQTDSHRSMDPCYSVIASGKHAFDLTSDVSINSFGTNSFFDRFDKENGSILNLNFDAGSTYLHFLEREFDVPYRFDKTFEGYISEGNKKILSKSTIYVRYMDDITYPRFEYFDNLARGKGKFVTTNLGRGQVGYISAKDCKELIQEEFLTNPFLLTQGSGSKEFPNFKKEQTYVPVKDKYE